MSNASNHQDSSNQLRPIDPIEALPQEMLSRVFFFLPPSSIATSSALNKVWRNSILSNPVLHQGIDLTKLNRDEDMTNILYHFSRLSSLASNRLVKVSLNLTAFWNEFVEAALSNNKRILLFDVFLNLLRNSRESLKELSVVIGATKSEYDNPIGFILLLIQELQGYTSIKSIVFEAHVEYSLTAGDGGAGSRSFVLMDSRERSQEMLPDEPTIPEVLREVKKLVEGKITEFKTCFVCDLDLSREESQGILRELEDSRCFIRTLGLRLLQVPDEREFWDLAISCPQITSLELLMAIWPGVVDVNKGLEVPLGRDSSHVKMKKLEIKSEFSLDWTASEKWIGNSLETLSMECDSSTPVTFSSHKSLKDLYLFGTFSVDPKNQSEFPLLQSLDMHSVSPSCFSFFSTISSPQLTKLSIRLGPHSSWHSFKSAFECLRNLLNKYAPSLVDLDAGFRIPPDEEFSIILRSSSCFRFHKLRKLTLDGSSLEGELSLVDWLSSSPYPNLISLKLPYGYKNRDTIVELYRKNSSKAVIVE